MVENCLAPLCRFCVELFFCCCCYLALKCLKKSRSFGITVPSSVETDEGIEARVNKKMETTGLVIGDTPK